MPEPPIGIEPMTYALRGACSPPAHPLAAPITRAIAQIAHTALGFCADPVHEPVHGGRVPHGGNPPLSAWELDRSSPVTPLTSRLHGPLVPVSDRRSPCLIARYCTTILYLATGPQLAGDGAGPVRA